MTLRLRVEPAPAEEEVETLLGGDAVRIRVDQTDDLGHQGEAENPGMVFGIVLDPWRRIIEVVGEGFVAADSSTGGAEVSVVAITCAPRLPTRMESVRIGAIRTEGLLAGVAEITLPTSRAPLGAYQARGIETRLDAVSLLALQPSPAPSPEAGGSSKKSSAASSAPERRRSLSSATPRIHREIKTWRPTSTSPSSA